MEFINTILFELGGKPVLLIDLLSAVFGLTVVFLAGRNSKYNFYVGYLYTALLFFMFWQKHLYANLILQPISLGINILGQYRWSHPRKGEETSSGDLKVTMLSWPWRSGVVALVLIMALVWGWLMSQLGGLQDFFQPTLCRILTACDSAYTYGSDAFGTEEVGLLDSMAFCEHCQSDTLSEGGSCVHAYSKLPLPGQRHLVAVQLV